MQKSAVACNSQMLRQMCHLHSDLPECIRRNFLHPDPVDLIRYEKLPGIRIRARYHSQIFGKVCPVFFLNPCEPHIRLLSVRTCLISKQIRYAVRKIRKILIILQSLACRLFFQTAGHTSQPYTDTQHCDNLCYSTTQIFSLPVPFLVSIPVPKSPQSSRSSHLPSDGI